MPCRNKTLQGNRAERNEFILLHRLHQEDYVVPDKISSFEAKAQAAAELKAAKAKAKEAGESIKKVAMTKKKYAGGLVFEPEKGLWDRYVLVMDFNSLYPSIIQEYDIDFSTIDQTAEGVSKFEVCDTDGGADLSTNRQAADIENMPDRMPCEGEPQGILPQLIASLVARRRQVKSLMKDKSLPPGRHAQVSLDQSTARRSHMTKISSDRSIILLNLRSS